MGYTNPLTDRQVKVLEARINRARISVHDLKPKIDEPEEVAQARALVAKFDDACKRIRDDAKDQKEQALLKVNSALAWGTNEDAIMEAVLTYEAMCKAYLEANR